MIMSAIQIELPVSKSLLNRAMIAMAGQGNFTKWLEKNSIIIANGCRDTQLLVNALSAHNQNVTSTLNFQDAGTPCRLFTAFAAANFVSPCQITGNESLNSRSIEPLVSSLIEMGADISYLERIGYTPIAVNRGITAWRDVRISAALSSQYASALLLIAPCFGGNKKLTITEITHSHAYIGMTLQLLKKLNIQTHCVETDSELHITILGEYKSANTHFDADLFESDWSSSAFFYPYLLGLPEGATIELLGLKMGQTPHDVNRSHMDLTLNYPPCQSEWESKSISYQGDVAMWELGNLLGIKTIKTRKGVLLSRQNSRFNPTSEMLDDDEIMRNEQTLHFNLKNNPDLVPALVVGWCILGKSVIIRGIENLRFKECDRIAAIQENIKSLGCTLKNIGSASDDLWILNCSGRSFPNQLHVNTHSDHRIAMAFSSLKFWIPSLSFSDTNCVEKSFPKFWEQLKKCTFD
jgi:3-phosphoshikimate 1-carboxyvinyltransferase